MIILSWEKREKDPVIRSFKVLVKELQSLGLDIKLYNQSDENEIELKEEDDDDDFDDSEDEEDDDSDEELDEIRTAINSQSDQINKLLHCMGAVLNSVQGTTQNHQFNQSINAAYQQAGNMGNVQLDIINQRMGILEKGIKTLITDVQGIKEQQYDDEDEDDDITYESSVVETGNIKINNQIVAIKKYRFSYPHLNVLNSYESIKETIILVLGLQILASI